MTAAGPWSMLVAQTWQVTLLAVAVGLIARWFAKDRPHLAHALWILVLLKCVTPPIWSSPTGLFSWLTLHRVSADAVAVHPELPSGAITVNGGAEQPIVVHMRRENDLQVSTGTQGLSPKSSILETAYQAIGIGDPFSLDGNWRGMALLAWLAGAAIAAAGTLVRLSMFLRWIRRNRLQTEPELEGLVRKLAMQLKIGRRVRVMLLDCPLGPSVIGLVRPTILLPSSIVANQPHARLRPLIAHELVHVRRGDLWWALIQTIAKNLFWFHPLIWWAARMVTRESERSCDEETIASLGCRPSEYARGLLDVLEQKHRLRVAPALPGVRPVDITSARLERVMRLGQGSQRRTPLWVWLIMLTSCVLVLPGAARVVAQQPHAQVQVEAKPGDILPQPLPPADLVQTVDGEPTWRVAMHDVSEVLEEMRAAEFEQVEEMLLTLVGCRNPGADGTSSTLGRRNVELSTVDGIISLGDTQPTMKIVNNTLYAFATQPQLNSVSESLARMNEYGFAQIGIETQFIMTEPEHLKALGIDWSVATAAMNKSIESGNSAGELAEEIVLPAREPNANERQVLATSYVERNQPVLFAVLDQEQRQTTISALQQDRRSNLLTAPKVTLFNGQRASIMDIVSRPFVVGLDRIQDASGAPTDALQPVIRIIQEGQAVNLKAIVTDDRTVSLEYELSLTKILGVEDAEIPIRGEAVPASIQIPEVATTRIESSLDVPQGKTLVMSTVTELEKGKKQAYLVLVTCTILDTGNRVRQRVSLDPAANSAKQDREPAPASRADGVGKEEKGHDGTEQRGTGQRTAPVRRPDTPTKGANSLVELANALHQLGDGVTVVGDLHQDVENNRVKVEGRNLKLQDAAKELSIEGFQGVALWEDTDLTTLQIKGGVKVLYRDTEIRAMIASRDSHRMWFSGESEGRNQRVMVRNKEIELVADHVSFGFDENANILLEGDVRINQTLEDGTPTSIRAERITWNPQTNEILAERNETAGQR